MTSQDTGSESNTINIYEQGADTDPPDVRTEVTTRLSSEDIKALRTLIDQDDFGDRIEFSRSLEDEQEFTIRSKQYVGSVGLPSGRVLRIHPKISERTLSRMLAYTGESNTEFVLDATTLDSGFSFIDALAKQLEAETSTVIQQGLRRSYNQVTKARDSVRGQINLNRQLQRQPPVPLKFECTYDEFSYDTLENQALLRAVSIAAGLTTSQSLRHDLRQSQVELERHGVSRKHVQGADMNSITLSRLDTHYESAVSLARVFIERNFIEDSTTSTVPVSSFLVGMNNVFERLVRQVARDLYEQRTSTHRVTKEPVGHFVKELPDDEGFGRSLPPDVVIKNRGEYEAVMDAKWTMTGPKMDHFYQMVAYMTVMQVDVGVLVYPQLEEHHRQFYTKAGKEIVALELPVRRSDLQSQYSFEDWLRSEFESRLRAGNALSVGV